VVEMNSRLGIGELLETKTEAAETIKTVVVRLEQQSGKKLKRLCTDIGKEWLNKVVGDFCRQNSDNQHTTQTPEYTKDKYNVKIKSERVSVRGSPGTLIPDILAVKPKASQSTDGMICGP
jgi:phage host-nuclease inhibitor protein Gam